MIIHAMKRQDTAAFIERFYRGSEQRVARLLFPEGDRPAENDVSDRLGEWLSRRSVAILIAEAEGAVEGFLALIGNEWDATGHRARVAIFVREAARQKGIGGRLLRQAEQYARKKNMIRLELTVPANDRAGLLLAASAGFHIEGMRRDALHAHGHVIDEFYLAKILS